MTNEETLDREPTPEEIQEMRERMEGYYVAQIPFLEKQLKYETLLAEIEIARARRVEMTIRIAQMTTPMQQEEVDNGSDNDIDFKADKRKIKK